MNVTRANGTGANSTSSIPVHERIIRRLLSNDESKIDTWKDGLLKYDFSSTNDDIIIRIISLCLDSQLKGLPKILGENESLRNKILSSTRLSEFLKKDKPRHRGVFFSTITDDSRIHGLITESRHQAKPEEDVKATAQTSSGSSKKNPLRGGIGSPITKTVPDKPGTISTRRPEPTSNPKTPSRPVTIPIRDSSPPPLNHLKKEKQDFRVFIISILGLFITGRK